MPVTRLKQAQTKRCKDTKCDEKDKKTRRRKREIDARLTKMTTRNMKKINEDLEPSLWLVRYKRNARD